MIIGLFLKNWRLLIDIAIVVGIIVAFSLWDPFRILSKSELKPTANLVTSVKEIGQLVTAEYYGEVISSRAGMVMDKAMAADTLAIYAPDLYLEIKTEIGAFVKNGGKRRKLDEHLETTKIEWQKDEIYRDIYVKFISFLHLKYSNNKRDGFNEKKNGLRRGAEMWVFKKMYDEIKSEHDDIVDQAKKKYKKRSEREDREQMIETDYAEYLKKGFTAVTEFETFYQAKTNEVLNKSKLRKKDIVFIGRGWVKAGFDFGKLDEHNFHYDKGKKTIHMFGFKAAILDADINPWFIPEQKVKGFELVDAYKNATFHEAKEVKKDCKDKLLAQADKADILKRAEESGKEAFQNFFGLLLNEPDIQVKFHVDQYEYKFEYYKEDSFISKNEAIQIDSIYRAELDSIRYYKKAGYKNLSEQKALLLSRFISRLKEIPFESDYSFSYYTSKAAELIADGDISEDDLETLTSLKGELGIVSDGKWLALTTEVVQSDSLWFATDSGRFRDDFNNAIDFLVKEWETENYLAISKLDTNLQSKKVDDDVLWKVDSLDIIVYEETAELIRFGYPDSADLVDTTVITQLKDLRYLIKDYDLSKREIGDSLIIKNLILKEYPQGSIEGEMVSTVAVHNFVYDKKVAPVQKFTKKVNSLFDKLNESLGGAAQ